MARLVAALLTALVFAAAAYAQPGELRWPERPIRMVVPFTAGSSSDTVAGSANGWDSSCSSRTAPGPAAISAPR
jgi:tripartite-type tricarboxylate transporter receptor subunit TctC